jgi:hypothetical protein
MESAKKVVEFKNILSTITDRSGRKDDEAAPKPLSRALGGRPRLPFQASTSRPLRTSADHTLAQALNFSDESLALNSTNMELTSCSPTNLAGIKRKHDQERLLMEGELETVKSKVLSLETQLDSEKTARKRMKVEHEKEWRDLQVIVFSAKGIEYACIRFLYRCYLEHRKISLHWKPRSRT